MKRKIKQLTTVGEYHDKLLKTLNEEGYEIESTLLKDKISTMSLMELVEHLNNNFGGDETERLLGLTTKELRK